jgi:hypothetical protein
MKVRRHFVSLCAGIVGIGLCSAGVSRAMTITVENLSQNTATGVYEYAVLFDSQAYVQSGDGFVLYGFSGLTNWTLTGSGGSGSLNSSGNGTTSTGPIALTESTPTDALTDGSAQTIAQTDAATVAAENNVTLDPTATNLSFVWGGATYTGSATAILTIDTSVTSGDTESVYASVDRSGTNPGTTYGTAEGTVFVPGSGTAIPEPVSGISSMLLLSLVGLRRHRRSA